MGSRHFGAPNLPKVVKLSQGRREPLHQGYSLCGTDLPTKAALLRPNVIQVRIMHALQSNKCWLVVAAQRFHSTNTDLCILQSPQSLEQVAQVAANTVQLLQRTESQEVCHP